MTAVLVGHEVDVVGERAFGEDGGEVEPRPVVAERDVPDGELGPSSEKVHETPGFLVSSWAARASSAGTAVRDDGVVGLVLDRAGRDAGRDVPLGHHEQ